MSLRWNMTNSNPLADTFPDHEDQSLVLRARSGDRQALEDLVHILDRGATSPPGSSQRCTPRRFATASPRCADLGKLTSLIGAVTVKRKEESHD